MLTLTITSVDRGVINNVSVRIWGFGGLGFEVKIIGMARLRWIEQNESHAKLWSLGQDYGEGWIRVIAVYGL